MKTFRDVYGNKYRSKFVGNINCSRDGLETLDGAPVYVSGGFYSFSNNLPSLEGAPKYIGSDFSCFNSNVESLEGAPKYIGRNFSCYDNRLKSLEGAPMYVGGVFYCDDELLYGENLYIIITSLIRGRYNRYIKEGEEFKEHILKQLEKYFTR